MLRLEPIIYLYFKASTRVHMRACSPVHVDYDDDRTLN